MVCKKTETCRSLQCTYIIYNFLIFFNSGTLNCCSIWCELMN
jgi:hypothetical protein